MGRGKSGTSGSRGSSGPSRGTEIRVDAQGRHVFSTDVSRDRLLDVASRSEFTHRGTKSFDVWTLGVMVSGRASSEDYPSVNGKIDGSVMIQRGSNGTGTYDLRYPVVGGGRDEYRSYKTLSAAQRAGRAALKRYINGQYKSRAGGW